jgi:hypothetical protein
MSSKSSVDKMKVQSMERLLKESHCQKVSSNRQQQLKIQLFIMDMHTFSHTIECEINTSKNYFPVLNVIF